MDFATGLLGALTQAGQGAIKGYDEARQQTLQNQQLQRQRTLDNFNYQNALLEGLRNGTYTPDAAKSLREQLGMPAQTVQVPNMVTKTTTTPMYGPTPSGQALAPKVTTSQVQDGTKTADLFDTIKPKIEYKTANGGDTLMGVDPNGNMVSTTQVPYQINPKDTLFAQTRQEIAQERIQNALDLLKLKGDTSLQIAGIGANARTQAAQTSADGRRYQPTAFTDNQGNPVMFDAQSGQYVPVKISGGVVKPGVTRSGPQLTPAQYTQARNAILKARYDVNPDKDAQIKDRELKKLDANYQQGGAKQGGGLVDKLKASGLLD